MVKTLLRADHDGTAPTKIKAYTAPTVLVIDDVGLLPLKAPDASAWFFEVVDTRYNKGLPTIVTTNRGLPEWGSVFATPSSPPPSWTASCTTPSCSTSEAPAGASKNTTASKSPSPNPPPRGPANLTNADRTPRRDANFG